MMLNQSWLKQILAKHPNQLKGLGLPRQISNRNSGFTVIEMLVVIVIIGILSGIAVPGWLGFINRQKLNKANERVYLAIQNAQSQAKKDKRIYTAAFQMSNNIPQLAVYPKDSTPTWENIVTNPNEISLNLSAGSKINFDYEGNLIKPGTSNQATELDVGEKIVVTLANSGSTAKRCIIVKTLLGALDTGKDNQCN